jgi:glycosyltransferase involved in cell wall biosynthesis
MRRDVESLIRECGMERHVKITGWATNAQVREHMLASRGLVLPSFAEGLPVVMMEALALKRPVIGTTIAGVPELVKPGVSGWLVPAGDVDALADAMREAVEAPIELLERMGAAGARAVAERHNIREESRKLAEVFMVAAVATSTSSGAGRGPAEPPVRATADKQPAAVEPGPPSHAALQGQRSGVGVWAQAGRKA